MAHVLIVYASPFFRDFVEEKLASERITVTTAQASLDAFIKMITGLPDLIILEVQNDIEEQLEFLRKKHDDLNAGRIPIVAVGPAIDQVKDQMFSRWFSIVKYLVKPMQFDALLESIGRVLKIGFSMDATPCTLDMHKKGGIIFVEIAEGINREKLAVLKYKLNEMIEREKIEEPKIVLMISGMDLTFVDGYNLEALLDGALSNPKVQRMNVKVLSTSLFAHELIHGHPSYDGIEVSASLAHVLNSLVESEAQSDVFELIAAEILESEKYVDPISTAARFESGAGQKEDAKPSGNSLRIALVDDDKDSLKQLEEAFKAAGARCDIYEQGTEFMAGANRSAYNLVVFNILMHGISGFDILLALRNRHMNIPVMVYSRAVQYNDVIQALSLGAKHYLTKPQKPELVVKNAMALLRGTVA